MQKAINIAKQSQQDLPIACLIVKNNQILAQVYNQKEKNFDVTSHCEILAIRQAQKKIHSWHLCDCKLFVTLEPCPMCAWAILEARINTVVFGAFDLNYGAFESRFHLQDFHSNGKNIKIVSGICEQQCKVLLQSYFKNIR